MRNVAEDRPGEKRGVKVVRLNFPQGEFHRVNIGVALRNGGELTKQAYANSSLAVHMDDDDGWCSAHCPSGKSIGTHFPNRRSAMWAVVNLNMVLDWGRPAEAIQDTTDANKLYTIRKWVNHFGGTFCRA